MEIGNIPQGANATAVSTQPANTLQASENGQVRESPLAGQKDFQLDIKDGLKAKLAEFVNLLQERGRLIKSLPEDIQKAVAEVLQQMLGEQELPQGLVALLQGQKNVGEQLKNMGSLLEFAAVLNKDGNNDVQKVLQEILQNFTNHSEKTPEQAAKDLLQLAKQLFSVTTMPQGNLKQAVEQLLQQTLPENIQQLSSDEQKIVTQLTKLLGKDMPAQLQQLVQDNELPELPGVVGTLKTAEAWQLKDIQPKTLQAAADLLRQLAAEMPGGKTPVIGQLEQFIKTLPSGVGDEAAMGREMEQATNNLPAQVSNKPIINAQLEPFITGLPADIDEQTTANAQLEKFIKTLPAEIGKALQQALIQAVKQGNIPDSLSNLAETFSNTALLNEKMSSDVQSFILKNVENLAGKSSPLPVANKDLLVQLVKQFTDKGTTSDQLKTMINQLNNQLFPGDPKLLEKSKQIVEQLTQLFQQNIPQVLQEGEGKHNLPELAKIWVLLKALTAKQWQNIESQTLQKSASTVKELAQSMYKSTALAGEKQMEHSILSFSVPLQVAAGVFYPAHIHIYHQEQEKSSEPVERQFETWLRVSVDTEHIGMVDSVFRLYADNKLDVRVNFPHAVAVDEFLRELPNIRKDITDSKLTVADILVNKI